MKIAALLILFVTRLTVVTSFTPTLPLAVARSSNSATHLMMAGFGGGGGGMGASSKKNQKKNAASLPKLKAKAQWDRYADLKQCMKVVVGVKLSGDGEGDWLEVGKVRSENDEYTLIAIARQRALIADHAKRLYPVKIPANSVLTWGYKEDDSWVAVDKSVGDDASIPKGIEKKFGFEGISDKASGFYCYYSEGRIVERGEDRSVLTTGSKTLPN